MFLERTITIFTEALKAVFDDEHPAEIMRGLDVRVDYPLEIENYPCLWVNFTPIGTVRNVGVGHVEYNAVGEDMKRFFRWNFSGTLEITIAALTSLERARMTDWVAKTIAFGRPADTTTPMADFRRMVDQNDLIGLRMMWESFTISGAAETPGTPWGTDDIIYENTVTLTVEGEFAMDPDNATLVPLSAIVVEDTESDTPVEPPPYDDGWR